MRIIPFSLFLFYCLSLNAQKFALIENKGKNAQQFDIENPNSFLGILMNNIDLISSMVDQNGYRGVYENYMLEELGVSNSEMLSLTTSSTIRLWEPQTNEEVMVIKTQQSLGQFLDSVKEFPIYEGLFNADPQNLQQYWDNSCEYCPLRIFSKYYFDIRHTIALLIEEKPDEKWVHFIGELSNGKRMVTLSLRTEQLEQIDCFKLMHFASAEEGDLLYTQLKKQAFDQIQSEACRAWIQGKEPYFMSILSSFGNMGYSSCLYYTSNNGLQLMGVRHADSLAFIQQTSIPEGSVNESTIEQQKGSIYQLYAYETENFVNIIRTDQPFALALETMKQNPDYTDIALIDSTYLENWWTTAQVGDTLRNRNESQVYWKEGPAVKAAFYYQIGLDSLKIPCANISELVFYTEHNGKKINFITYNYEMAKVHEEYFGAILTPINKSIQTLATYMNTQVHWSQLLDSPTKKRSFLKLSKQLQIINTNLDI
jgi:hypothetical protein